MLAAASALKYCGRMNLLPVGNDSPEALPAGVPMHAPPVPLLRRIFGRSLMDMAVLVLVAVIFSVLRVPAGLFGDPDIWWHMANARILDQTHHFIRVEPYSFTVAGQRWVDPEWLSEMFFWLGYKNFALVGVYLAAAIGICGNVLFLYWRSCWKSGSASVALWTSGLGFLLMTVNTSARTILFAYLALSLQMAILEAAERGRERLIWLLPPLFCVWINLHGSWIIGIALLTLYILCGWFRVERGIFLQEAFSREARNRLLIVLGVSLACLFINPYGWRLLWNPFDMAFGQTLNIGNVQEWQPLNLGWFVGKAAALTIALMIVANAVCGRKWRLYELALFFFAWYAAFAHARFTFLAAVLTLPMVAADLTRTFFPPPAVQKTIPLMNVLMAVGAAVMVSRYVPTQLQLQQGIAKELPMQTIASMQTSWRVLNQDDFGGLMDFYSKPTFVDTRWDTFEHHGVMKDFIDILHLRDTLRLLDQYRIDHVLVKEDEPLAYLLERTPGWAVLRKEGDGQNRCVFFGRIGSLNSTPAQQPH